MSKQQKRKGYYLDADGNWQADRRSGKDRRKENPSDTAFREQRKFLRRKADRELYERDHKQMIEEALDDFAQERGGAV